MSLGQTLEALPLLACIGALAWAACTDIATYRIPNRLTLALAALWPVQVLSDPAGFSVWTPLAAALVLAAGYLLFAWGKLGGGDAKLMAAVALWVGVADLPAFVALTALAGGALALAAMVEPFRGMGVMAAQYAGIHRLRDGLLAGQLPYGVAIAAGGLAVLAPRLAA